MRGFKHTLGNSILWGNELHNVVFFFFLPLIISFKNKARTRLALQWPSRETYRSQPHNPAPLLPQLLGRADAHSRQPHPTCGQPEGGAFERQPIFLCRLLNARCPGWGGREPNRHAMPPARSATHSAHSSLPPAAPPLPCHLAAHMLFSQHPSGPSPRAPERAPWRPV